MSRKILGIDVGDKAVTAVVINSRLKGNWVEQFVRVPINGNDNFDEEMSRALEVVAGKIDAVGAVCVAALPVRFVSFRNLTIPFKEKKKINQVLPFELEPTLPYPPEDVVADFIILDRPSDGGGGNILAAALEKHRLESFLNLLKTYGIEPEVVTVSGIVISQCLSRFSEEARVQLLIHLEEKRTTMVINHLGQVALLRTFSGQSAEQTDIDSIFLRIRQTLSALEERNQMKYEIDDVWLSGTASLTADAAASFEKMLGVPATPLNLMAQSGVVTLSSSEDQWNAGEMDAALALGLAEVLGMQVVNFRQGRFAVQKAWEEHKNDILKTGLLAAFISALFLANVLIDYYAVRDRAVEVQKEIVDVFRSTFPEVTKIVDPLHQMRLKVEDAKKGDLYPEAAERGVDAIEILNVVSRFIPEEVNVALNSIIIGSDSVLISGDTDTFNAVDDMKSGLEKAEAFKEVSISSANMDKSGARVRFKLKITI